MGVLAGLGLLVGGTFVTGPCQIGLRSEGERSVESFLLHSFVALEETRQGSLVDVVSEITTASISLLGSDH
jgi:hypothetical protein